MSLPFQRDPASARALDAEGLHVDVFLDLARQLIRVGGQQAAEVPGEDIELFEVGVGKGQHLGEERHRGVRSRSVGRESRPPRRGKARRSARAPVPAPRRAGPGPPWG